jgi:hypothetical protein
MASYNYVVGVDFTSLVGNDVDLSALQDTIFASLNTVQYLSRVSNTVTIYFSGALSGPQQTTLLGIVNAYTYIDIIEEIVTDASVSVFTNKDLKTDTVFFVDPTDITKRIGFAASGSSTGLTLTLATSITSSNKTITIPNITDTLTTLTATQTLTNKTLTTPIISQISNTGTLTLPTSTDTLVGRATTDTLTNKTLTTPIISQISNTGALTLPTSTDTLVGRAITDTLTNKTLGNVVANGTGSTTASTASIYVNPASTAFSGANNYFFTHLNTPTTTGTTTGTASTLFIAGAPPNATNSYALNVSSGKTYINGALQIPTGASNGFILTSDASGNASWATQTTPDIVYYEVIVNGAISTTSATLINVTSLTITPLVAGIYKVSFTSNFRNSSNGRTNTFAIAKNGTAIPNTISALVTPNTVTPIHLVTTVSCNGTTDVVSVQFSRSSNTLFLDNYRYLLAERISS